MVGQFFIIGIKAFRTFVSGWIVLGFAYRDGAGLAAAFHFCPRCRATHIDSRSTSAYRQLPTALFVSEGGVHSRSSVRLRGVRSGAASARLKHTSFIVFRESLAVLGAGAYIAALGCIRSALSLPHPCNVPHRTCYPDECGVSAGLSDGAI